MPWYVVNGMSVHLNFGGRQRRAPPHCRAPVERAGKRAHCCGVGLLLCDWPTEDGRSTCSMPMCREHATEVGKDRHYCPRHAPPGPPPEQPALF